jgi:hypothetical protein
MRIAALVFILGIAAVAHAAEARADLSHDQDIRVLTEVKHFAFDIVALSGRSQGEMALARILKREDKIRPLIEVYNRGTTEAKVYALTAFHLLAPQLRAVSSRPSREVQSDSPLFQRLLIRRWHAPRVSHSDPSRAVRWLHPSTLKGLTRRQSQRPWLSRLVLRAARAAPATVVAHLERWAKYDHTRHPTDCLLGDSLRAGVYPERPEAYSDLEFDLGRLRSLALARWRFHSHRRMA